MAAPDSPRRRARSPAPDSPARRARSPAKSPARARSPAKKEAAAPSSPARRVGRPRSAERKDATKDAPASPKTRSRSPAPADKAGSEPVDKGVDRRPFMVLSAAGLLLTWYYNIMFMFFGDVYQVHRHPEQLLPALADWLKTAMRGSLVSAGITHEMLMTIIILVMFIHVESFRRGIAGCHFYSLGGYMVAIAFTFPLFAYRWLSNTRAPKVPTKGAPVDFGRELLLLRLYMAASAFGFSYCVTCTDENFRFAILATYIGVSHVMIGLVQGVSSHPAAEGVHRDIDAASSRTVEQTAKFWGLLSIAICYSARLRMLSTSNLFVEFTAVQQTAPFWSITWDYVVLATTACIMVLMDPEQTKHRLAYATATLVAPPIGMSAYIAQKEIDRRGAGATECALVDIGRSLAALATAAVALEIILLKLFSVPEMEYFVFTKIFGSLDYYKSPTRTLWHIGDYVSGRGGDLAASAHVFGGLLYVLIAPLQLHAGYRKANLAAHRWVGRLFFLCSLAVAYGLYAMLTNHVKYMYDSVHYEWFGTAVFAAHFVVTGVLAYWYAYTRDIMTHRRWVIRHLTNGIAVGCYRLLGGVSSVLLVPILDSLGGSKTWFGLGIWLLWPTCIFFGEVMVQYRYWEPGFPAK